MPSSLGPAPAAGTDWVSHVEACYRLDLSTQDWLRALASSASRLVGRPGAPVAVFEYAYTALTFRVGEIAAEGPPEILRDIEESNRGIAPAEVDMLYRGSLPGGSLSATLFRRFPAARETFLQRTGGRVRDVIGWRALTGLGSGVMTSVPLPRETDTSGVERRRWTCLVAHMGAGLRLRQRLSAPQAETSAEALLDGGGRLHDAAGAAREPAAQDRLRAAVLALDRARSRSGRQDADSTLQIWQGLVDGRWSLVDRFDTDGRRFVVAYRNDPELPDPRGLSQRERQVAELAGMGQGSKQIAYALGTSPSSVENSAARAARKLGLANRAELAAFFSPAGPRRKLSEAAVAGERMVVGAWPLASAARLEGLTGTEREIALRIVQGFTNAAIAAARGTSALTVAAQVSAIYRKLGVRSRTEIAAALQSAPEE